MQWTTVVGHVAGLGGRRIPVEEAGGQVVPCLRFSDHVIRHRLPEDPLHHGKVLAVVVGLEQRVALQNGIEIFIEKIKNSFFKKKWSIFCTDYLTVAT